MVTDDDQQHRGPGGPVAEADGTVPAVGVDGLPEPDPRPGEPAETSAGPSNGADPAPSATVTPPGVPADVGSDGPAPAVVEDPAAHPPPAEPPAIAPGPAEPRPLRSQHARRRRKRRITVWSVVALAVVVVAAAVVVAVQRVDHPLAQPTVASGHPTVTTVPGTAPTPPWPVSGQAAVAIPALGYAEQSGPEQPVPIASLTKMTTAVVVLRDHPVPLGADGPTITITPDEAAQFDVDLDNDETNIPLQAGETLTELQLLEALLNQSANDAAYTLAEWDAGSQPAFVAKMNALAASLGADGSHYVDASGFDPRSVSTAADTLRIAGAGMAIPTFAVVAGMPTVNLPGVGTVRNIVTAIGTDGIVGVKSGYTSQASGCMVLAGFRTIGGRSVLVLASALGQREPDPSPAPPATAAPGAAPTTTTTSVPYSSIEAEYPLRYTEPIVDRLLDAAESAVVAVPVVATGHTVGTAAADWGGQWHVVPVVATQDASLLGVPGQQVAAAMVPEGPAGAGPHRGTVGAVRFTLGSQTETVPVRLVHRLPDPGWWWKVLHNS